MVSKYWKQFKSGSDIRGIASENPNGEKITLTNEAIRKISIGFAVWVSNKYLLKFPSITIAVGNDSRTSAMRIKTATINSLRSIGISVYDCSMASTPAMFNTLSSLTCNASIQITASHHPSNRNGLKFFTSEGGLSSTDIDEILETAQSKNLPYATKPGNVRTINIMPSYCERLRKVIHSGIDPNMKNSKPLKGLKIIVDAGNGVGGFFVNDVLNPLGANTKGSLFLEPDGNFPNHVPNPEDTSCLNPLINAVKNSHAHLGICFDTDVDRIGIIDSDGNPINQSKLIALASAIVINQHPGATIVTDSVASDKLKDFIEELGGKIFRYKRGYNNVINTAKEFNDKGIDCPLAIETSGHAALRENNFMDDGAYLAAKIIVCIAKSGSDKNPIQEIIKNLIEPKERIELRIPINSTKVITSARKVITLLKSQYDYIRGCELQTENIEGVRLNFTSNDHNGWCILRKSVHDPILVLNVESYISHGSDTIIASLFPFFKKFDFLDLSEYTKYIVGDDD